MNDLKTYFGSYAKVAPAWAEFVKHCDEKGMKAMPGFRSEDLNEWKNKDGSPQLIEVNEQNYPKIYKALHEECEFRKIPVPACYVNTSGKGGGGSAWQDFYAISIEEFFYDFCNERELRWIVAHEIKHLYHPQYKTPEEACLAEDDCDRAGVEAAGYEAAVSYFQKLTAFKLGSKIGISPRVVHAVLPAFLSSHFPVAISANNTNLARLHIARDPLHPSPLHRMRAMYEHSQALEERACNHS